MSVREKNLPFIEGESVESRSFQTGYRGAWFRCKIKSTDKRRNGHFGYDLEYMDFPDEKTTWTKAYQKSQAYDKKSRHHKPSELMVRPSFPLVYRESEMPDVSTISEMVVVVNDFWKVGDLIDWWTDGCYWSGSITQLQKNDLFQIVLLPPPLGEGLFYKDCRKEDLRPSLNWSLEYGWTVPTPTESGHGCCARLVYPVRPAQQQDRWKNIKGKSLVSTPTKEKHTANTSTVSGMKKDRAGKRSSFPDNDSSSKIKSKSTKVVAKEREPKLPFVSRTQSKDVETEQSLEKTKTNMDLDSNGDSSYSGDTSESSETGDEASVGKDLLDGDGKEISTLPLDGLENVEKRHLGSVAENETRGRASDVDSGGCAKMGRALSEKDGLDHGGRPTKKGRVDGKMALNSDSLDTIEASILDLEELLQRVKWMKGLLQSGKDSSDTTKPPWKFLEHGGSSTKK